MRVFARSAVEPVTPVVRPRRVLVAATLEIVTGVALAVLAILAASAGPSWEDIPIWLGVVGALGIVSGVGLLYQVPLAGPTSMAFGLITGAGALLLLALLNSPPLRWAAIAGLISCVLVACVLVIYGSGSFTVRRFGAVVLAVVVWVWVIPIAFGPRVECVDIDPVACDTAWRGAVGEGPWGILPLSAARVETDYCPQYYFEWGNIGLFSEYIESFC
jgi:hypothetical protein